MQKGSRVNRLRTRTLELDSLSLNLSPTVSRSASDFAFLSPSGLLYKIGIQCAYLRALLEEMNELMQTKVTEQYIAWNKPLLQVLAITVMEIL